MSKPQLFFRAPAREFVTALKAVAQIADRKDTSETHDSVRIESTPDGLIAVSASNPSMIASMLIPDSEVLDPGAIEMSVSIAKQFVSAASYKDVPRGDRVDVLVAEKGDCAEVMLEYGLPIPVHVTKRPIVEARYKRMALPQAVIDASSQRLGVPVPASHSQVRFTPAQATVWAKAAAIVGESIEMYETEQSGRFVATIGKQFACVFTCRAAEQVPAGEDTDDEFASVRSVSATPLRAM